MLHTVSDEPNLRNDSHPQDRAQPKDFLRTTSMSSTFRRTLTPSNRSKVEVLGVGGEESTNFFGTYPVCTPLNLTPSPFRDVLGNLLGFGYKGGRSGNLPPGRYSSGYVRLI